MGWAPYKSTKEGGGHSFEFFLHNNVHWSHQSRPDGITTLWTTPCHHEHGVACCECHNRYGRLCKPALYQPLVKYNTKFPTSGICIVLLVMRSACSRVGTYSSKLQPYTSTLSWDYGKHIVTHIRGISWWRRGRARGSLCRLWSVTFSSYNQVTIHIPLDRLVLQARPTSAREGRVWWTAIQVVSHRTVQCGPIRLQYLVTWHITSLFE